MPARSQSAQSHHRASPFQIPWEEWKQILWRTYVRINEDRLLAIAAGVVFFGLLAIFPAITALVSFYGLFANPSTIAANLQSLALMLPEGSFQIVQDQIARVLAKGGTDLGATFLFGLALAIWSANAGVKALIDALNVAYGEREKRSFLQLNLLSLAFTIGGIVDSKDLKTRETAGDFGSAYLLDHSAGSGPFMLDHWTKNTEFLLKANPNFGGTKPTLSGVLFKHVQEPTNQQFALEKGDIDIANDLGSEQIAALQGKAGVTTTSADSLLLVYVGMNAMFKPLDNVKVREALRTAVDYDGIVKDLLKGNGKKVQGIVPKGLAGYNESTPFQADSKVAAPGSRTDEHHSRVPRPNGRSARRRRLERHRGQAEVRLGQDRRDREHQGNDYG